MTKKEKEKLFKIYCEIENQINSLLFYSPDTEFYRGKISGRISAKRDALYKLQSDFDFLPKSV